MPRPLVINGIEAGFTLTQEEQIHWNAIAGASAVAMNARQRIEHLESTVANLLESMRVLANRTTQVEMRPVYPPPNTDTTTAATTAAPVRVQPRTPTPNPSPIAAALNDFVAAERSADARSPTPATPTVTLDTLRGALQSYSTAHGIQNARMILQRFGATTVSQVPEDRRVEAYAVITTEMMLPSASATISASTGA